ncbi:unnamed protein product, partial [Closterium sp. NIES-54]
MPRRSTLACPASPPAAAIMARERQRALALACSLVALQLASPLAVIHAQPLQASQVQFLKDCQTAWSPVLFGWGGAHPVCSSVEGITCDSSGMVLELNISELNVTGSIPDSISSLRKLSILNHAIRVHRCRYLQYNQLTGSIPAAIGTLTNLKHL